jgi:hypothetical protein
MTATRPVTAAAGLRLGGGANGEFTPDWGNDIDSDIDLYSGGP